MMQGFLESPLSVSFFVFLFLITQCGEALSEKTVGNKLTCAENVMAVGQISTT